MNIKYIVCIISLFVVIGNVRGQTTIGSGTAPVKGALLDTKENESATGGVTSTKGILCPRVSLDSLNSLTPLLSAADAADATQKNIHKGAVVYNVKVSAAESLEEGFYYWDAIKWRKLVGDNQTIVANPWAITGNTGTDPSVNYVGTKDNQPLALRVNNTRAGYISNAATGTNSLGINALQANTGMFNTAVGGNALQANTNGMLNTAIGAGTLASNQTTGNNTAIGALALNKNTESNNTAVGVSAMTNNITGKFNTAVGESALQANTSGTSNTAVGRSALSGNIDGQSNVAVGNASLPLNTKPNNNATLGYNTLSQQTTGDSNTAVGSLALDSIAIGSSNTVVGYRAGRGLKNGNNNIVVGAHARLALQGSAGAVSNTMNIGNAIFGRNMTGSLASPGGRIGIGTAAPDTSAIVDLTATNKGLLIPRVNLQDVNDKVTVPNPATGLLVFSVISKDRPDKSFYYNTGTPAAPVWTMLQPRNTNQGVQVRKGVWVESRANVTRDKLFVPLGRFSFAFGKNASTGNAVPCIKLMANPGKSVTVAFHMGEYWQGNGYSYTSDQYKTFDSSNWDTYQIITSDVSTTERNTFWCVYPGDPNLYSVDFLDVGADPTITFGIEANMY
jgi:hypothetical protein